MNQSQNTTSFALLFTVAFSIILSSGCKLGNLPKMPEMPFLKKDSFKLSRSKDESVAPPSRTFDPKPSHFATLDNEGDRSTGQMASNDAQPIRKPYDVASNESPASATPNDSFGFPKNSKSLAGNNDFKMPDANQFRQAMNNTTERAQEFVDSTQQSTSDALNSARDFVASRSGDFGSNDGAFRPKSSQGNSAGSGFRAQSSQDFLNESAAIARNVTQNQTPNNEPKWKSDFSLPQQASSQASAGNRTTGNDFRSSVQNSTNNLKNDLAKFNQNAMNRANEGFRATQQAAQNVIQKTQDSFDDAGQRVADASGQLEQSWQNTVDQANKATQSIRNANPLSQNTPRLQPSIQGDFRPAQNSASAPNSSSPSRTINSPSQQFANQGIQPAKPPQRSIEVTPEVEFARQPSANQGNSQFASTHSNAFQPNAQMNQNRVPASNSSIESKPEFISNPTLGNTQQANSPYPSTNYNSYINAGRAQVSQVTPIAEPNRSAPRNQPAAKNGVSPRTASLPSELLRGNSDYAPGSIKQLSPIK